MRRRMGQAHPGNADHPTAEATLRAFAKWLRKQPADRPEFDELWNGPRSSIAFGEGATHRVIGALGLAGPRPFDVHLTEIVASTKLGT